MKKSAQTVIREGSYYTISAANGRVLEVANYNTENGASIQLWSYEGEPWQQWTFLEAGEKEYRIQNRFTGKVMDLVMNGKVNGTWVQQWAPTLGAGQKWQLVPVEGKVKLRNVMADKVVDLVGLRMDNGTQAQIWTDVDGENQLWSINLIPAKQLKPIDGEEVAKKRREAAEKKVATRSQTTGKTGGKSARRTSKNK